MAVEKIGVLFFWGFELVEDFFVFIRWLIGILLLPSIIFSRLFGYLKNSLYLGLELFFILLCILLPLFSELAVWCAHLRWPVEVSTPHPSWFTLTISVVADPFSIRLPGGQFFLSSGLLAPVVSLFVLLFMWFGLVVTDGGMEWPYLLVIQFCK